MLVPKKMSPLRKTLLLVVVVLIFAVVGYLLYDRFGGFNNTAAPVSGINSLGLPAGSGIQTEFDLDFINSSPYTTLKKNGNFPVQAGNAGRPNPFAPIPLF